MSTPSDDGELTRFVLLCAAEGVVLLFNFGGETLSLHLSEEVADQLSVALRRSVDYTRFGKGLKVPKLDLSGIATL